MASSPAPQTYRLPASPGQMIDRNQPFQFTFDGKTFGAYAGDTIASALAAAGVRTFSRSFKYHRRRGLLCVSGDCPNCLVQVGDEPNVRSCRREVDPGMEVRSQNAWPSLQLDLLSLTQTVSRFLPVGFYYKAFMRPRSLWPVYEKVLRHAAGLGVVDPRSETQGTHKRNMHCQVAVVGGGPAGIRAALAASSLGAQVVLLAGSDPLGGQLRYRWGIEGGTEQQTANLIDRVKADSGIQVLQGAVGVGLYERKWIAAVQGDRLIKLRAGSIVVATGAVEELPLFENNDLPGVLLGSAVQRLIRLWGVRPGNRAVVVSTNPHGEQTTLDLLEAGVEVPLLLEVSDRLRNDDRSSEFLERIGSAGTSVLSGFHSLSVRGRQQVEAVEIIPIGNLPRRSVPCDLLVLSTSLKPAAQLLNLAGAEMEWNQTTNQFLVRSLPEGIFPAGGANGTHEVGKAMLEGELAGRQAAHFLGLGGQAERRVTDKLEAEAQDHQARRKPWSVSPISLHRQVTIEGQSGRDKERDFPAGINRPIIEERQGGHPFVCLCEDVELKDIQHALQEGYEDSELLKRYSTVSMGPCQGKMCGAKVRDLTNFLKPGDGGHQPTTTRPPLSPVKIGHYAGRLFEPTRLSPIHAWHTQHGAKMMVAGPWMRPEHYGDPKDEVQAVRRSVGLIDVSTLGKMHLQGPDTAKLLEFVYTNRWGDLQIGRVRYGLMVNEEGVVLDDGVTARLEEDLYYMTTTSGGAARVYEWMEWWLQSQGNYDVRLLNATDLRAAMNLTGPHARRVLSKVIEGIDLKEDHFPYFHVRQGVVSGVPALLLRIGFTGELGYEIHVPSGYGLYVWESLMQAGQEYGIRPFGVEAQRVLRLEKGHIIVGQDTDSLSNPLEAGLGWAVKLDKGDFLGKPSLLRVSERGQGQRLVGFEMEGADPPKEAEQIVKPGSGPRGLEIIGRVTSVRHSETLDRTIGLCWLPASRSQSGDEFLIFSGQELREARVVDTPFYDPAGKRLRGNKSPDEEAGEGLPRSRGKVMHVWSGKAIQSPFRDPVEVPVPNETLESIIAMKDRMALIPLMDSGILEFQGEESESVLQRLMGISAGPTGSVQQVGTALCARLGRDRWRVFNPFRQSHSPWAESPDPSLTKGSVTLTDVSHGFGCLLLLGDLAGDVLGGLCALDLRETAFPHGSAAETSLARVKVMLLRWDLQGLPAYLILANRSLSQYVLESVVEEAGHLPLELLGQDHLEGWPAFEGSGSEV